VKNKHRHNEDGTITIFVESKRLKKIAEILIDTEDLAKFKDFGRTWSLRGHLPDLYAVTSIPHPEGGWRCHTDGRRKRRKSLSMHNFILGECPPGLITDHIDGNRYNNCKNNLRWVTQAENAQNCRLRSDNTSGFKGICWYNKRRWKAGISLDKRRRHIGYFDTKEEAAEAYDRAVVKYREIINPERQLNFPHKLDEYLN